MALRNKPEPPPQTNDDPLLAPPDAANHLGVSVGTLEVWRSTKRYNIPYVKVGRLVRYRKSALDAFLDSRTIEVEANANEAD